MGREGGAIKCFCFIYKERDFRRPLLKEEGLPLSQLQAAAKPSQRGEREIGGPKGPQTPPQTEPQAFSPHPQCIYPGGPSGRRNGVSTQAGVAPGWGGGNNLSAEAVGGMRAEGSNLVTLVA